MKIENDILIPEIARLLAEGKEVRFTPSGVSMRPYIEGDSDSVILKQLNRPPRVGDILLARVTVHRTPYTVHNTHTTYVLHRLIRIENDRTPYTVHRTPITYILQGDGNLSGEERCSSGDILGTVIRIENPQGRRKLLTRGRLWFYLRPLRKYLLKIYRHSLLKWRYN